MAKSKQVQLEEEVKAEGLEIISIGSLYNGPWDKKYWSSSRGKDRYPYPVGYLARRAYNGNTCKMEIHEGPKGPVFAITSADGRSCSGQTPDIAWEKFQKKCCPRVKVFHGKRLSCNVDGIEFFGFKNPFVQRLLRELVANINGVAEQSFSSSSFGNGASASEHNNRFPKACTHSDLLPYLTRPQVTGKRSKRHEIVNPMPLSAGFKRARPGDQAYIADISKSTHENHKQCSLPSSTHSHIKKQDFCGFPGALRATEHLKSVAGEKNSHLSGKDGLHLKYAPTYDESILAISENCKSTSVFSNLSAEEKPLRRSQDTKEGGLNFPLPVEDKAGDAPPLKESQGVHNVDLYAPDTLEFVQDDIANSPPSMEDESTCNEKEELIVTKVATSEGLVTESHPGEEMGKSNWNSSSEKSDIDSTGQEIAKSMMTVLLPQAIPLLRQSSSRKKKTISYSENFCCVPKSHEENNGTGSFSEVQSPGLDHSVVQNSEHAKSVILDSFDDDQCENHVVKRKILSSNCAKAEAGADEPCLNKDAYPPHSRGQLVNHKEESSVCHVETGGSENVFHPNEVQLALTKKPSGVHGLGCTSALKEVSSEENQDVCKSFGEIICSEEKDLIPASDCNEASDTSNTGQRGTRKEIIVKERAIETGNMSVAWIPKKVYTRKKNPKCIAYKKKHDSSLSEGIICRNLEDGCVPESTRTLPNSESVLISSSVDKSLTNHSSSAEAGVGGRFHGLHAEKTNINCLLSSTAPSIAQSLMFGCTSNVEDISNIIVSSAVENKQIHSEERLVGHENVLHFDDLASSQKQDKGFCCNNTPSTEEFQANSDFKIHRNLELNNELEGIVKLVGCYFHPMPVSSLFLSSKGNEIYICALCGLLMDRDRSLFLYKLANEETRTGCPSFVGHTTVVFPSSTDICGTEIMLERSGLQLTPDGQSLVLLGGIKTPYCREGSVDCLCSTCTSDSFEHRAVKIVQVKAGYASVLVKLVTVDSVQCILVCESDHLVAGESGRLHVWTMNLTWSAATEEFVIPANDYVFPFIVELKRIPKSASLIVGHNGFGEFTVWDVSKCIFMSRFSAARTSIYQFLPISLFRWQQEAHGSSYFNMEEHINRKVDATKSWFSVHSENSIPPLEWEDIAVWLLVSTVPDSDAQHDYLSADCQINPARWWRLALLVKNTLILGNVLDPRAAAVGTSAGHGIIGTLDGLVYMWELSTGNKIGTLHCFKRGNVSCIVADDSSSGALAIAGEGDQVLVFRQLQQCKAN